MAFITPNLVHNVLSNIALEGEAFNALKTDYDRDGFVICDFDFDPELIEKCRTVTAAYIGRYGRMQDLWRRYSCVRELAAHPKILHLLTRIYGRRAFPFQTLNFTRGTQQPTHADTVFFNSEPAGFMCGVWVALEDINLENGPLRYYVGSHKRPTDMDAMIEASRTGEMVAFFATAAEGYAERLGVLKQGQTIIWSAQLLHGGSVVSDPSRTRLSQVTHCYFDDCLYITPIRENRKTGAHFLRNPYDFSRNKFVRGQHNGQAVRPHIRSLISGPLYNLIRKTSSWK